MGLVLVDDLDGIGRIVFRHDGIAGFFQEGYNDIRDGRFIVDYKNAGAGYF